MKTFFMNGKFLRGMGTILHDQNHLKINTENKTRQDKIYFSDRIQ